jgi:hypothetical protein
VLYLGFSIIQIIVDLFRGQQNSAFLKIIVMIIFTILLNQLCIGGLTILSWFIVFIPFIMMTYVTTILLYVFGLNPTKGKEQPDPRRRRVGGGCAGTEFGCCPDGLIASNKHGSNCYGLGPSPYHQHDRNHYYYITTTPTTAAPTTTPTTAAPTTMPTTTPTTIPTTMPTTIPTTRPTTAPVPPTQPR